MKPKIDAIQGLRGIAILYVVLFHAGNIFNYHVFSHGATGVCLFFVISGFTISYTQTRKRGVSEAFLFTKKRIVRIYLPYLLPFLTMLVLFLLTGRGDEQTRDIGNIVRNLFLVHLPSQSIYPYSWYLVYQIYFYFTFGFLVILCGINIFVYCVLMVIPFIVSLVPGVMEISKDAIPFAFANLFFISGIIISMFFDKIKFRFKYFYVVLALMIFIGIPFWVSNGFLLLACTLLLFLIFSKSIMSITFLNSTGDASYSIYIIHAIVLAILKNIIYDRSVFTFIGFLIACLGSGWLYYVYFEKPITRYAYNLLGIVKKSENREVIQPALIK